MKKTFILNNNLRGYPKGYKIFLEVDKKGKPTDRYWSNRFEDAKADNCISLYKESTIEKSPSKLKEKEK